MDFPKNLNELYSGEDLTTLFKEGFINFGYWKSDIIFKKFISEAEFVEANCNLYKKNFTKMEIKANDHILEVGCGHGAGCVLLAQNFNVSSITGLDYFQSHVDLSLKRNESLVKQKKIAYTQGIAEAIPFDNHTVDKIYTIEAFQHFVPGPSIAEFSRVLKPSGLLVLSTFFLIKPDYIEKTLQLLPRPAILSDKNNEKNVSLSEIIDLLKSHNFQNISIERIGEHVWPGYDKWVRQNEPGIWDTNWLVAYRQGLLDYFIITAKRQ